jgi:predicted nucleic acid-binding protein
MALTHLLDTSAWLAHIFDEPGADAITALLENMETELGISTLSIVETHGRFRARGRESEFDEMLDIYRRLFTRILPVSEAIALRAIVLREAASARVPAIDSLIAATAAHHGAILVHRDPHFLAVAEGEVKQQFLAVEE